MAPSDRPRARMEAPRRNSPSLRWPSGRAAGISTGPRPGRAGSVSSSSQAGGRAARGMSAGWWAASQ